MRKMNNDIRKLIDDNWEDIKELIFKKAEAEQKPKSIWDLETKDSKEYYRIEASGCIEYGCFDATYDEYIREVGNAFLTREELRVKPLLTRCIYVQYNFTIQVFRSLQVAKWHKK